MHTKIFFFEVNLHEILKINVKAFSQFSVGIKRKKFIGLRIKNFIR